MSIVLSTGLELHCRSTLSVLTMMAIVSKYEEIRNVAAMIVVSVFCVCGTIFMLFVLINFHRDLKGKDSYLDRKRHSQNRESK